MTYVSYVAYEYPFTGAPGTLVQLLGNLLQGLSYFLPCFPFPLFLFEELWVWVVGHYASPYLQQPFRSCRVPK